MGTFGIDGRLMFSVVIPTYNRAPILRRMLAHLATLEGVAECEVLVVNDGSTDETGAVVAKAAESFPGALRAFELMNGGPARARNYGVQAAANERILFIDDDVFPRPGMLQSHWRTLDEGYTGSQGVLLWHSDIALTPLIQYIDSRGSQFAFDRVQDDGDLAFAYVYTGNFAVLRRTVQEVGGFDETLFNSELAFSAFEDTILGYQLKGNGAKLALNREAVADHLHDTDEEGFLRREYKVGYAIGMLGKRYPAVAESLGLDRKDFLVGSQAHCLRLINRLQLLSRLVGYSLAIRLRHREAFYRGFLHFKRDTAKQGFGLIQ